jgi:YegS/Rv2252/BmrU family lipid kinase
MQRRKLRTRILVNRGGGSVGGRSAVESALNAAAIDCKIEWLDGGKLQKTAEAAVAEGIDLLIAGGGDGTISAVAEALADSSTRLGVLPLGTLNHFARDLGIPTDLEAAAKLIATGTANPVDVAELNGRIFVNNSAIGLYPLMVLDRDKQQRRLGRSKRLAMLVAAARTLLRFHHQRLTLTVNGRDRMVDTPLLFVGNNDYQVELPAAGERQSLSDGRLCVLVMRSKSRTGFLAATVRALIGKARATDMVRLDDVQQLRVDSARSHLHVAMDGETLRMAPPLEYRIRPKALKVIVP